MRAEAVIVGVFVLIESGSVVAQDVSRTEVSQMNVTAPGQAAATGAIQIEPRSSARVDVGPFLPTDRQVTGSTGSAADPVAYLQLNRETATVDSGPQLTTERGGVGPAPSPRALAQGRVTAVVMPRGLDRCDPRAGRVLPEGCDRIIESRASDFPTPDPQPLSAEQRLLAMQRELRPMSLDVGTATRRLASGEVDDSTAALAVASMALRDLGPVKDEEEEPAGDTSAIDAIVAGITTLVTGAPPNP